MILHDQIHAQNRVERPQRSLHPHVAATLAAQPFTAYPLDTVRTAIAAHEVRGLCPTLDYPVGPAYHLIGFDTEIFTFILAARLPGWTLHIAEELGADNPIEFLPANSGPADRRLASG
jgi:citrate synthase